jgi:OOP family OmpA-OmpF porin
MKHFYAGWLLAGLAAWGGATAHAAEGPERELGLLLGGGWADEDLVGSKDDEFSPLFGLRYGQRLNDDFNVFGDLVYGPYNGDRAGVGDAGVTTLRGGVEWLFSLQQRYHWFLSGGLGLMNVDTDGDVDFTRPMASLGLGQSWAVGADNAFRWEVRADQSFGNDTLPGAGLTHVQALLGYSWGVGAPLDSDGDGVADRRDRCPGTPRGAAVDGLGCPRDSDGDGIPDDRDACPTVPAPGAADGCPPRIVEPRPAPAPTPAVPRKLTLEGVNFDSDSARLRPESIAVLDSAAATLREWGEVRVEVAGHTDSVHSDAYNLRLSQRRAEAVRAFLIDRGVAAARLTARGYGESQPVADNGTAQGRSKNRRVELVPQP